MKFILINGEQFLSLLMNTIIAQLKPQDSFGDFKKYISWSSESAGNHRKTSSDLPSIILNDIL